MDGFTIGLLMLTGMAIVPVGVAIVVLREGARTARRHAALAHQAAGCGLSAGTPEGVAPPDAATMPFGSPVELTGERAGIGVGVRRVSGPLDAQGVGVQVWAEIPELGFGLSGSAATVSGGPLVNVGDARFARPLYLTGSGIAARATLDRAVRDALLPLTQAGRVSLGVGRVVAVTRDGEPDGVRELGEWLDGVVAVARRVAEGAARPLPDRLSDLALHDPSREVRRDAAEALLSLGERAAGALDRLRGARDPAVAVIGELAAGDAEALIARADDSPEVIQRILDALGEASRGEGPPALVARLRAPLGPLGSWLVDRVRAGGSRGREAAALVETLGGFEEMRGLLALAPDEGAGDLAIVDSPDARGRVRLSE